MATNTTQPTSHKRKSTAFHNSNPRKRQKAQDARAIPVQSADVGFSTPGEINVAAFIKARDFEINALEKSIQKSRKGLTARAFQQVPRTLRRRTASHNVKKVPRRLRRRAEKEMKEDNTPMVTARRRTPSRRLRLRLETAKAAQVFNQKSKTVRQRKIAGKANIKKTDPEDLVNNVRVPRSKKNKLVEPPKATSKFKRRQINKTWLPTHLWHAKRAHMSKPTEPLWRMAIPIRPTEKTYRSTHRNGSSRGCVAWDMSYMSTIGCHGLESSLDGLLKSIGFAGEGWKGARYNRWKSGTRSSEDWVFHRDNKQQAIAPITVIWCSQTTIDVSTVDATASAVLSKSKPKSKPKNRRLFIRVHPSAFHQLWLEVIKVAKMQRPQVLLEDLRFEIGSIEITGPASTEALLAVLQPIQSGKEESQPSIVWTSLANLTNPATLPANAIFCFDVSDSRLRNPSLQLSVSQTETALDSLNQLIVSWPLDKSQAISGLFDHRVRYLTSKSMPSQKAIDRRKTEAAPGQSLKEKNNDPKIPILLVASRSKTVNSNAQGTWVLLLPWKCLDSIWRSLMYYNMTSGGTPQFGGLDQKRQVLFEQGQPWFPADALGSETGQAWERTQSESRFDEWLRRPPSRRIAWETVDLGAGRKGEHGNGWACDWEYLMASKVKDADQDSSELPSKAKDSGEILTAQCPTQRPLTQRQRKAARADAEQRAKGAEDRRRNTSSPESEDDGPAAIDSELPSSVKIQHVPMSLASHILSKRSNVKNLTLPSLVTIRITYLTRGTPNPAARVYRLPPTSNLSTLSLRKQWLALDPQSASTNNSAANNATGGFNPKFKKDKTNRHNLARIPSALPKDPLTHIQYLPPDAHPAVVAQFGAKAQTEPAAESLIEEERNELLAQLMFPNMTREERTSHPPCPHASDLIGFVTTGAYNLAQGKGMAIASVWLQRVLEGWKENGEQKEREKHLCVVRNAGEGVGRLASWELC